MLADATITFTVPILISVIGLVITFAGLLWNAARMAQRFESGEKIMSELSAGMTGLKEDKTVHAVTRLRVDQHDVALSRMADELSEIKETQAVAVGDLRFIKDWVESQKKGN